MNQNSLQLATELVMAAVLLPKARMRWSEDRAPWNTQVMATDARPGGHGLAYATVAVEEVQRWATYCSHRGDYTVLDAVHEDLALEPGERTHLRKVCLPGRLLSVDMCAEARGLAQHCF